MIIVIKPQVGVGGMLFNTNQELLLILRKKNPDAGCWSLPGGKVELYETIEEATIREIKEEIGVDIHLNELVCVTNHIEVEQQVHFVCPTFFATILSGTPTIKEPDKIADLQWFSLDQLPSALTYTTTNALKEWQNKKQSKD